MSLFGSLFRSSSASSSSAATTNKNTGASDHSIAASDSSTINVLDAGAVQGAFGFGSGAVQDAIGFGSHALDIVAEVNQQSADALAKSFAQSAQIVSQTIAKQTLDSGERVQTIVSYLIWAVAGVGGLLLLSHMKKRGT